MYTKIFLLVLILNIIPQKASNGNSSQKQNVNIEHSQNNNNANSTQQHSSEEKGKSNPWGIDWSDMGQHSLGHQNSDDDGKTHHVHFQRYLDRRHRYFYCLLGKLVLLISYCCSFFINYCHLSH
jgi:hypothetical protein